MDPCDRERGRLRTQASLTERLTTVGNLPLYCSVTVLERSLHERHHGHGWCIWWLSVKIYLTLLQGKGYPDVSTRAMTRYLSTASPRNGFRSPPVYGLMDYDPDGMAIFSTYKHGSAAFAKEKDTLTVPSMRWVGLRSKHVADGESTHTSQGLLQLSKRDRHKARKMLESQQFTQSGEDVEWRRELQVMLMLNLKAEVQLLEASPDGLCSMIRQEISACTE